MEQVKTMEVIQANNIYQATDGLAYMLLGDPERKVDSVRPIHEARCGCLTYLKSDADHSFLADQKLHGCIVICAAEVSSVQAFAVDRTIIITNNPRLAFMRAVARYFQPNQVVCGVHPTAVISPDSRVNPSASVGPYVIIGPNCEVDSDVVLHPHVTLYAGVKIGRGTVVNSGTVIGADGFGYERNEQGVLEKFPHIGGVLIGEYVEIGTNTSIDRGTIGDTVIGDRVRIDNQVHISHNVNIGADTAVIAHSMIGGSVRIGQGSWIAPSGLVMNQVQIGASATVGMGAVVVKDVPRGSTVTGSPAVDIDEFRKSRAAIKNLLAENNSKSST